MKARIKETGRIVDIEDLYDDGTALIVDGDYIRVSKLEFIEGENNSNIDWQQVRIQAAIAVMQGILAKEKRDGTIEDIAFASVRYTDALIEELKKNPINNK